MQTNHDTLRRVEVHCGDVIDGVAPFYDSTQTVLHGYRGGTTHTFLIPANDPITKIWGRSGNYYGSQCIVQLRFTTRSGAQSPVYGSGNNASDLQDFELTTAPGEELSSFLGSLAYGDNTPDRYLGSLGATFRKA